MSTVQEIIDTAQARTSDAITQANYFVDQLENIAGSWTNYRFRPVRTPLTYPSNIVSGAPVPSSSAQVDYSTPNSTKSRAENAIPGSIDDDGIDEQSIPEFNQSPVEPNIPEKPDFTNPGVPTGNVNLTEVSVNLGDKPEAVMSIAHQDIAIPDPSAIDVGTYTIPNPEVDYLVPTNEFSFVETEYSSQFRDTILAVLVDDIQNGGTGINPADEQSLFERARDREAATFKDSAHATARNFAARGFKIPPSAMAALMNKARDGFNKAMSGINRDIMLKRSELHVQARQFAIQAGTTLENAMLSYHGAVMERALNVAKFAAQFGIEYHNLQVQAFQDRINTWKTVSDVKTQWIDNAIKATKEYELKLAKMELTDKQNRTKTDLLNAMNRAVEVAENIRESELKIGSFQLENNKLRIEQSKLLTQNYAEIMRGNETAFRAYAEAIRAETLRNETFKLNLEAHKEQRQTALTKLELQVKKKEGDIKVMAANMQRAEQILNQYYKELDVVIKDADQKAKRIGLNLEAWRQKLDASKASASLKLESQKANISSLINTKKLNLEGDKFEAQDWMNIQNLRIDSARAGVGLYENLIMGAQSALGTIATLSE